MTSLKLSDAYELVSKKILINKMSIENLNNQIEFSTATMKMQAFIIRAARRKITLINSLNDILEKQLNEFDEFRQSQCIDIYKELNELDSPTDEYIEQRAICKKCDEAMLTLTPKIEYIERTIPNTLDVTNYKIKEKSNAPTAYNCATETLAFGSNPVV
jgi:hypothetical protein